MTHHVKENGHQHRYTVPNSRSAGSELCDEEFKRGTVVEHHTINVCDGYSLRATAKALAKTKPKNEMRYLSNDKLKEGRKKKWRKKVNLCESKPVDLCESKPVDKIIRKRSMCSICRFTEDDISDCDEKYYDRRVILDEYIQIFTNFGYPKAIAELIMSYLASTHKVKFNISGTYDPVVKSIQRISSYTRMIFYQENKNKLYFRCENFDSRYVNFQIHGTTYSENICKKHMCYDARQELLESELLRDYKDWNEGENLCLHGIIKKPLFDYFLDKLKIKFRRRDPDRLIMFEQMFNAFYQTEKERNKIRYFLSCDTDIYPLVSFNESKTFTKEDVKCWAYDWGRSFDGYKLALYNYNRYAEFRKRETVTMTSSGSSTGV
jgi:hypothetical protein